MIDCSALSRGFVHYDSPGYGNVQGCDLASHRNPNEVIASATDKIVKSLSFAAQNQSTVEAEIELVIVDGSALIETNAPNVISLEFLQSAHEIGDAGYAHMLRRASRRLGDCCRYGSGTTFRYDNTIDSCALCSPEQCSEIMRVFYAIEGEDEMILSSLGEQV